MKLMKKENKTIKNLVEKLAVKIAVAEANTVCSYITYQPKLPQSVKKLRKF